MKQTIWFEASRLTDGGRVRYYDPDTGDAVSVYCANKQERKETENRIGSLLLNYRKGNGQPDAIPLVVLEDYLQAKKDEGNRASTIEMKRKNLTPFLETVYTLGQITHEGIKAFVKLMHTKYKVDTVAIRLRDLRAFLNWCKKEKLIKESPFVGIQIPVSEFVGRRLSMEEIQGIYAQLEGEFKAFITLALDTGARHGELLSMEWAELDFTNHAWFIPAHKCKTRINRTVPLTRRALEALVSVPRAYPRVFGAWTRFRVQANWKRVLRLSGLQGRIRIHDLRHTWASNWQGAGSALKAQAGWSTDQMMGRYTHVELKFMAGAASKTSDAIWGEFGANGEKSEK